ncbi:MAG: hypothetical protein CMM46_08915 [Rhodospirillaceae bacterium]|nr:hypothetical protein [Rhodospirillaceae bacterium]
MNAAPRCGARTRWGTPCPAPAIRGRVRCSMHGGRSPGAPAGNARALKHGLWTREEQARCRAITALMREARAVLRKMG